MLNFLREKLEAYRAEKRYRDTDTDWRAFRESIAKRPLRTGALNRLVIIPCDPWTLTGSKGDEAMIQAVVKQLKDISPKLQVALITGSEAASETARKLGYEPIQVWRQKLSTIVQAIETFNADGLAILGADCMDGYYSADMTLCMVALADIATRLGIRTTVLGFSFNNKPAERLAAAFNEVDERVNFNVRDAVSLERFNCFSSAKGRLVADAAFMLPPVVDTPPVIELQNWAATKRAEGRQVLGFNVHPMLIKHVTPEQLDALKSHVEEAIRSFLKKNNTAIAFISHDYRGSGGDDTCLKPIFSRLEPELADRLYYREVTCSAAEIKGMAGLMDGVLTGRMHLAIASLGMGVPIAALTYQDKFQGLMKHMQLPDDLLIPTEKLMSPAPLLEMLTRFSNDIDVHRETVKNRLSAVKKMSADNITPLLQ